MLDLGYTVFHRSAQKCIEPVNQVSIASYPIIHNDTNFNASHSFEKTTTHKQFFSIKIEAKLLEQHWEVKPQKHCPPLIIQHSTLKESDQHRGPPSSRI